MQNLKYCQAVWVWTGQAKGVLSSHGTIHILYQTFTVKPFTVSKFQENYIKALATETYIFSGQSKGFIYWFNVDSKHTALPTYSSNEYKGSTLIKQCASLSLIVSLISNVNEFRALWAQQLVSNWILMSCQLQRVTSGQSNSVISKCTLQNSSHI